MKHNPMATRMDLEQTKGSESQKPIKCDSNPESAEDETSNHDGGDAGEADEDDKLAQLSVEFVPPAKLSKKLLEDEMESVIV